MEKKGGIKNERTTAPPFLSLIFNRAVLAVRSVRMNTWTDRYRFIKIPPHCEGLEKSAHGQIISRVLFPLVIKGVLEMGFRSFAPTGHLATSVRGREIT